MRNLALLAVLASLAIIPAAWSEDAPSAPVVAPEAPGGPQLPAILGAEAAPDDKKRLLPSVGRTVLVPITNASGEVVVRPAIVTKVVSERTINAAIITDAEDGNVPVQLTTLVHNQDSDALPGTWRWLDHQIEQHTALRAAAPAVVAPVERVAEVQSQVVLDEMALLTERVDALAVEVAKKHDDLVAESARAGAAEGRERELQRRIDEMERDAKHGA